jgi:DMSO/TMAO reductase YedYZ molybdopterin-dependent catalytic subunit
MTTRGFSGRRPAAATAQRLPPGQSWTADFPVLSYGPTPAVDLARWTFTLKDGPRKLARWNWSELNALPQTAWRGDIHCVTKWWRGIALFPRHRARRRPIRDSRAHRRSFRVARK